MTPAPASSRVAARREAGVEPGLGQGHRRGRNVRLRRFIGRNVFIPVAKSSSAASAKSGVDRPPLRRRRSYNSGLEGVVTILISERSAPELESEHRHKAEHGGRQCGKSSRHFGLHGRPESIDFTANWAWLLLGWLDHDLCGRAPAATAPPSAAAVTAETSQQRLGGVRYLVVPAMVVRTARRLTDQTPPSPATNSTSPSSDGHWALRSEPCRHPRPAARPTITGAVSRSNSARRRR